MAAMKLLIVALVGTLHLSAAGLTNIEIHATKGEEAHGAHQPTAAPTPAAGPTSAPTPPQTSAPTPRPATTDATGATAPKSKSVCELSPPTTLRMCEMCHRGFKQRAAKKECDNRVMRNEYAQLVEQENIAGSVCEEKVKEGGELLRDGIKVGPSQIARDMENCMKLELGEGYFALQDYRKYHRSAIGLDVEPGNLDAFIEALPPAVYIFGVATFFAVAVVALYRWRQGVPPTTPANHEFRRKLRDYYMWCIGISFCIYCLWAAKVLFGAFRGPRL